MTLFSFINVFCRFGIILMVFGEIGNFSAYGFAPASLVAPLGTTTVIGELKFHFNKFTVVAQLSFCGKPIVLHMSLK